MSQLCEFISKVCSEYFSGSYEKFYQALVQSKFKLSFEEFQSVLSGKIDIQKETVSAILNHLDQSDKDRLIQLYCESLFPEQYANPEREKIRFSKQKANLELNEFQVQELAKSKIHYYLFLILLLKSEKIKRHILKKQFGSHEAIDTAISDLTNKGILIENDIYIYCASPDVRFPPNSSDLLKKLYAQFDDWDRGFAKTFQYENLIEKTLIRKVNTKHIAIIQKQIEAVMDTIRTSESVHGFSDQDNVVFLQLNLARSK